MRRGSRPERREGGADLRGDHVRDNPTLLLGAYEEKALALLDDRERYLDTRACVLPAPGEQRGSTIIGSKRRGWRRCIHRTQLNHFTGNNADKFFQSAAWSLPEIVPQRTALNEAKEVSSGVVSASQLDPEGDP